MYKAALDKAYETYGIKFTHISADANEADKVDTEWIIYFADRLENETDECYNYGEIKIVADVNYSDDFEYSDAFLSARGYAPLYTTDYGGAFEVTEVEGNKVLMQMINADNKPTDWRFRGTPTPITSLGDDRWSNYSAEFDFKLAGDASDNYVVFGVRYITAEFDFRSAENGNSLKIYPDGRLELRKNATTVMNGTIADFDSSAWHSIKITAAGINITAEVTEREHNVKIKVVSGKFTLDAIEY